MGVIHDLVLAGKLAEVQRLVDEDITVINSIDDVSQWTPLHCACSNGHTAIAAHLLIRKQGGASTIINKRVPGNGYTALFLASANGHSPMVELLLHQGADTSLASSNGTTPLIVASSRGRVAVVQCLLQAQPFAPTDVDGRDEDGETALWRACYQGHVGVVKLLLEVGGADPTMVSHNGLTPLRAAIQEGHHECIQVLQV